MKRCFMTLNVGLTLFMLPALYCMEQDENAKKLALFFAIKPVYQKAQPEYEDLGLIWQDRLSNGVIVNTRVPSKSTSMASKTPEQTTNENKTKTETK